MSVIIREAKAPDCPQLLALIRELARFERAPEQVIVTEEHFLQSGFGPHPVWWAFVAEEKSSLTVTEHAILGFALYYIRYSTWKGQRMYLEDIIVTQQARGQGIGKKLMDRLIKEAREKKFSGIVWQVLNWNEAAVQFYKKFGAVFDEEWVNCHLDLVDAPPAKG